MPTTCRTCGRRALQETLIGNDGQCMVCVRKAKDEELEKAVIRSRIPGAISLFSIPFFLLTNKSTSYRLSVLTFSQSLADVLDELELTSTSLTGRFAENNEHFYIVDLDLNPSGKAFAKIAFRSWFAKTDRWKPESKTLLKLKKSLISEYRKFESAHGEV